MFKEAYSHHRLRTEGNRSPYQLWIQGMTELSGDASAVQGVTENAIVSRVYSLVCTGTLLCKILIYPDAVGHVWN